MKYNRLGNSGLQISELSYGSWVTFSLQLDNKKAKKNIITAYDNGVNFFDNAEVYASGDSEKIMGKAIYELGFARDTYIVSSKVFWGGKKPTQRGLSAKHIREACDAALKRLRVDYLDLYFCHRPDFHTPIQETVRAMDNLIKQGKILYWGTSEWSADRIREAFSVAYQYGLTPPTMEQPEYNMFNRHKLEKEYLNLFKTEGLGTTIWSPLASGLLTGKYNKEIPNNSRLNLKDYEFLKKNYNSLEGINKIKKVIKLGLIATSLDISMAHLSIAWCLKNKNVSTVILGATSEKQLNENLKAADYKSILDDEIMNQINGVLLNTPDQEIDML